MIELFALMVLISFAYAGVRAAPWVPLRAPDMRLLATALGDIEGKEVWDIGCGDGRIVELVARNGGRGVGYEISLLPLMMYGVRWAVSPVRSHMKLRVVDLFHIKTWNADVVVMYLMPGTYEKLAPVLARELREGAEVISATWKVPGWTVRDEYAQKGAVKLYKYKKINGIL